MCKSIYEALWAIFHDIVKLRHISMH
jgi:hypothetical protein